MATWTRQDLINQYQAAKSSGWIDAFRTAAAHYQIPVEILVAIASRETNMRNILGDGGHGHGVMQIDDRSFPQWCASGKWKDPHKAIDMGAWVLSDKIAKAAKVGKDSLRVGIASYNAGGNAIQDYLTYKNPDRRTTGHDYSADVLKRAEVFRGLLGADHENMVLGDMASTLPQVPASVPVVPVHAEPTPNPPVPTTTFRLPPEGWLDTPDEIHENIRGTNMTKEMIQDFIRFFMKIVGTWVLATKAAQDGGITIDSWQSITSAALILGSFGWSLWSSYHLTKES